MGLFDLYLIHKKIIKMNKEQILKISFFIWFVGMLIAAVLKIMHYSYGEFLLNVSMAFYLVFTCMVIYEVLKSDKIERSEKIMWTIGMLFLGAIAGILYLLVARKRIVNPERNTTL